MNDYADLATQGLSEYSALRARLAPLAAADLLETLRRMSFLGSADYLTVEECTALDKAIALVNAHPEIDALLARGEAAEAECVDLRGRLAAALMRHCSNCDCPTPEGMG